MNFNLLFLTVTLCSLRNECDIDIINKYMKFDNEAVAGF
jgi:hypothetical protein